MKSGTIVVTLAGLAVLAGIGYAFIRDGHDAAAVDKPAKSKTSAAIVHVDDLGDAPEKFKGEIVLRAVVSAVNKPEGVFAVIDSREYELCGVLTCAKHTLPVKFNGDLPDPRTVVEVTGEVVNGVKGLVFAAKRVDRVP